MNSPRTGKRGDKQTNAAPQTRKYLSAHRDALHSQLSKTVKQRIAEAVRSKILDLSSLGLSLLPEDAKLITDLRVLLLGANNFTAVPANLANTFPSLEYLDLSHNSISSIPSTLADLPELRVLDLSENPGLAGSIVPAAYAPLRHQLALFVDDENIEFKEDSQELKDESRRRVTEDDYENGDEGSEGQADDSNGDDDDGGSDMSRGSFRKQNDLLEDAALSLHKFLRMVKELEDAADLQSLFSRLAAAKDPIFFKYLSKRYPKGENLSDGDSVLSVDSDRSGEGFALRQRSSVEYDRKEKEKYVKASREVGRSMKTSRLAMD
ncbi:hypothetical protein HDU84_002115 [Entophlyctis sp. JEL0112]|nr:hypothetical protein HDU84_002115 [Entophlyctis sp. JEL0112]